MIYLNNQIGLKRERDKMYTWLETVMNEQYDIEKILKRTNEKSIILLRNKHNGKIIVLKKYKGNSEVYKMLINIYHRNLPIIYEAVSEGDKCIIVEEYIEGYSVGEILEAGWYTEEGVEKVIKQLVEVLDILHKRNIVHRDIKPENIIVSKDGVVKLIDFNISRVYDSDAGKDTTILGTTGFAAPEQYGIAESDPRADIYAMGILINVMLTGEHPAKKLCLGKWKRIVNKCTRINPEERYQCVKDIVQ